MAETETLSAENSDPSQDPVTGTEQGETRTEAVNPLDEVRFTQRQVNAMIAASKRKGSKEARAAEPKRTETGGNEDSQSLYSKLAAFESRFQELDFREWAADKGLNREQRELMQGWASIGDPSTWDSTYEIKKPLLDKIAEALAPHPAGNPPAPPKPSTTADAVGASGVTPTHRNPTTLSSEDNRALTPAQRRKMWEEHVASETGTRRRFFRPRNGVNGDGS